jgi:hypothetical protein
MFSETWLCPNIPTEDLALTSYFSPERKDRVKNTYGGVIVYIKNNLHYTRRRDLEINFLENIWIELILENNKHILFGVFYRAPNSDAIYNGLIEDSIALAVDTNITNIIITGDFNYNALNNLSNRTISALTQQFSLAQLIEEPTHFTENSESIIDLIFVTNKENILHSGAGDHFLYQDSRYHI